MPGFANNPSGGSIMWADNVDFSGAVIPTSTVSTNGQLLIGSTAAPNIRVGNLTSSDASITITNGPGTIDLKATGSVVLEKLTPDEGGAVSPVAGNINVFGILDGATTAQVTMTHNQAGNFTIEDRAFLTAFVVDPSSTIGVRGTFTTIQAAITAAVSGQNIFIRPGTYTENLTLKDGVNLFSTANSASTVAPTIIVGKATLTSGTVAIDNICFRTNGDFIIAMSGTAINFYNCNFVSTNSAPFISSLGFLNFYNCNGTDANTGQIFVVTSSGSVTMVGCRFIGSGSTASTFANTSAITILNSTFQTSITTSNTAQFTANNSILGSTAGPGATLLTANGTGTNNSAYNCSFSSGTLSAVSIGTGVTFQLSGCTINTSNASAIAGAGTLQYCNVSFIGSSSTIATTTQTPFVGSNNAVKVTTPGAYPYTTIPQDNVILVDTSSARTITPLASPTTGQVHRIKDNVGSAAANNITITPSGKNIDGAASHTISTNYGSADIVYNGTQWNVL